MANPNLNTPLLDSWYTFLGGTVQKSTLLFDFFLHYLTSDYIWLSGYIFCAL